MPEPQIAAGNRARSSPFPQLLSFVGARTPWAMTIAIMARNQSRLHPWGGIDGFSAGSGIWLCLGEGQRRG